MPLTRLNNESADEDRTGTLRRGADSASSGFVEDLEHDVYKYGMAGRTFNGECVCGGGVFVRVGGVCGAGEDECV